MSSFFSCFYLFPSSHFSRSSYFISVVSGTQYRSRKTLQQTSAFKVCCTVRSEGVQHNITFENLFSIRSTSYDSHLTTKPKKAVYAELSGLSRKAIDLAIKSDMSRELVNTLKSFLNDIQDKDDDNLIIINNPNIVKHRGRPPKRLKSDIEYKSSKGAQALKNNTNASGDNNTSTAKGRMCGKCKQYGHYAKTCQA